MMWWQSLYPAEFHFQVCHHVCLILLWCSWTQPFPVVGNVDCDHQPLVLMGQPRFFRPLTNIMESGFMESWMFCMFVLLLLGSHKMFYVNTCLISFSKNVFPACFQNNERNERPDFLQRTLHMIWQRTGHSQREEFSQLAVNTNLQPAFE